MPSQPSTSSSRSNRNSSASTVAALKDGRRISSTSSSRSKKSRRSSYAKTVEINHNDPSDTNTTISDLTCSTEISNASAILATRKTLRKHGRESRHQQLRREEDGGKYTLNNDRDRADGAHSVGGSTIDTWRTSSEWVKVIRQVQKRRHSIIAIAFLSAICLPAIATRSLGSYTFSGGDVAEGANGSSLRSSVMQGEEISVGAYFEQKDSDGEVGQLARRNLGEFVEEEDFEGFEFPEHLKNAAESGEENLDEDVEEGDANDTNKEVKSAQEKTAEEKKSEESDSFDLGIQPYNLTDVFYAADIYDSSYVTLVWDPIKDLFIGYYSKRHYWTGACDKMLGSVASLSYILKNMFPWRFQKGKSAEFAMAVSGGDYPQVKVTDCVLNRTATTCAHTAPIMHFGSVFTRPMFPNMIGMPMPDSKHLSCFQSWVKSKSICKGLKSVDIGGELSFGSGKKFNELIPQVVWRGTEFGYLGKYFQDLQHPEYDTHIEGNINPNTMKKKAATKALRNMYSDLVPRWQGVVLTAEAEIDARRLRTLPWANIKFSDHMHNGKKTPTVGSEAFRKWEEIDFPAAGEGMSVDELAEYKYHIDLGGGGGTTWSGTLMKLAMPGLLFHHVTPTKDYIHDRLKPWVHYVPIKEDLSDLKEKYDWAEANPTHAFKISREATKFVRNLGTPEGFEQMFNEQMEVPLRKLIAAYQPTGQYRWRNKMTEIEGDLLKPVIACTVDGNGMQCPQLIGKTAFRGRARRAPPREIS